MRRLLTAATIIGGVCAATSANAQSAGAFERIITFGDSLSDGGRYAAAAPEGAGTFTTNPDPIWIDILAGGFGLESVAGVEGGLNFAEGGGRVFEFQPTGRLAQLPIRTQIEDFLLAGGAFGAGDLVTIQGGGNDGFAVRDGVATTDDFFAAATDLADLTQLLLDEGAGTVLVANLQGNPEYNAVLDGQLSANGSNALYLDVAGLFDEIATDPGAFGITNITDLACGSVSALFCLPSDLVEPNANLTFARADSAHPTGRVQAIQGEAALALVRAPGQLSQLPLINDGQLQAVQEGLSQRLLDAPFDRAWTAFGGVSYGEFRIDAGPQAIGLEEESVRITAGVGRQLSEHIGTGASVDYFDGSGEFRAPGGGFENHSIIATVFAGGELSGFQWGVQGSYGWLGYDDITRQMQLGEQLRIERGDTDGNLWSVRGDIGYQVDFDGWRAGPVAGISYSNISFDGYTEQSELSTSLVVDEQDYDPFRWHAGMEFAAPAAGPFRPFARIAYVGAIDDDPRSINLNVLAAPVEFNAPGYTPDDSFVSLRGGVTVDVSDRIRLDITVGGDLARRDLSRLDGAARLYFGF